jgi:hypothetical protein
LTEGTYLLLKLEEFFEEEEELFFGFKLIVVGFSVLKLL